MKKSHPFHDNNDESLNVNTKYEINIEMYKIFETDKSMK